MIKCFRTGNDPVNGSSYYSRKEEGYDGTGPYWVVGHIDILSRISHYSMDGMEVDSPGFIFYNGYA